MTLSTKIKHLKLLQPLRDENVDVNNDYQV